MAIAGGPSAVVFDVGGVLCDWDPRHLYVKLIPDPEELDWFLANVVTHAWHFQHDAGRSVRETIPELAAQFPKYADLIALYDSRWLETIAGAIEGTCTLVEQLAARGVPLYAITNFSAEFFPRYCEAYPVMRHFRDIVVSGEVKVMKPDPRIYEIALTRFGLKPGEAWFIDDRLDNVEAAAAAGFVPHHFRSPEALRAELEAAGLLQGDLVL